MQGRTHSATMVTGFGALVSVGEFCSVLARLTFCGSVLTEVADVILFRFSPDAREVFDSEVDVDMVL